LAFASGPASNRIRTRPSWTRFSSSPRLPALRRCLQLSPPALPQIRLAVDPWDLHSILVACSCPLALPLAWLAPCPRPCLELVSGSRLLQCFRPKPATSRRLSILRLPSCPGVDSRPAEPVLRPAPSMALRSRPQFSLATAPAGFALGLSFHSRLAPFASAQPSCRLPAPALDAGLAPFVSCHSFRPAFWPASLRRIGSRFCAFVVKRPSGMPLTLRRRRLAPTAPSGPRAGFQSLRSSPSTSAIGLWFVPPQTAWILRPSPLAVSQLPMACGPPGSRSTSGLRPCESALSPAPACVWLAPRAALVPASQSCLGVPVIAEVRLAPRFNLPGLPFRMDALANSHPSGAFRDRS